MSGQEIWNLWVEYIHLKSPDYVTDVIDSHDKQLSSVTCAWTFTSQTSTFCKDKQVGEFYIGKTLMNTYTFVMYMSRSLPADLRKRMETLYALFNVFSPEE